MSKDKKRFDSNKRQNVNRKIRAPKILCIDHNNENLGVIATSEALKLASENGLDLVQITYNGKIPTCKILDYGKYKYDQSKRDKINAKKQRESQLKLKEVKLRPTTDINDIRIKANRIDKFLIEGHNVKISIMFRGRELSHKDIALNKMDDLLDSINSEIKIIHPPKMDGKTLSATISLDATLKTQSAS